MKNLILFLFLLFIIGCNAPSEKEYTTAVEDSVRVAPPKDVDSPGVFDSEDMTYMPPFVMSYDVGDINYVIADSMIVNQSEQIVVTISQGLTREEVLSKVEYLRDRESAVVTNEIRIAPIMITNLIDPTGINFRIIPITPEEQFLETGEITFWKWNVTPLTEGTNPLTLTVNIKVGDNMKNIQVHEDFIYVYSTDTFWDKFVVFFNDHWEWLFSTLLIPLFIYLYKLIAKKRKSKINI